MGAHQLDLVIQERRIVRDRLSLPIDKYRAQRAVNLID
jgi:hypothetical protein